MHVIARLAALVPKPRVNLTLSRRLCTEQSPARAGGAGPAPPDQVRDRPWVQRLKRVFHIDIETCNHCGGAVKIIACIEDPAVIETTAWMQE